MTDQDHHDHHDHLSVTTTDSGVHGEHGHMHDHSMSAHMMNHVMSFHFGTSETVLFDFWKFSSVGGLVGSMIGIFILAVLYEGLKYYREHLFWRSYSLLQYRSVPIPGDKTPLPSEAKVSHICPDVTQRNSPLMFSKSHGYQTFLHIIQIVISYFLMLIFMTYNVWLALAVAFGSTTGFFLFGWKKSVVVDVTEHCH